MCEASLHQGLCQLECDSGAAQRLAGILASRLIGIHYSKCMRQAVLSRKVMVSNDEINASTTCALCRSKGTSPGIHADHQPNACGGSTLNHITPQVVAFPNAVGNVEIRPAAAQFNRGLEHDDGGCSI